MKKIVICLNTSWNIYNFRLNLAKALKNAGYEMVLVAPYDVYSEKLKDEFVYHDIYMNNKGTNPLEDIKTLLGFYNLFNKIKPDVVLSYTIKPNIYATLACSCLKIPIINNVSGLGTLFIKKSFSSIIGKFLYRFAFKRSAWVFFQNKTDKNLFINSKLVNGQKTSVLPGSGVNLKKFNCVRNSNKGLRFLFAGRLIGDKGIKEFIKAANLLSKSNPLLEFQIVGKLGYNNRTAISEKELNQWLNNPQIKYLGKKDNMQEIFKNADIMVLPSYREGLSKSLLEAASMKLPIITTDVPGCSEVVDEGKNGFLCKVQDANDLYTKMKKMISITEQQRLDMGNYSRKKVVKEFNEQIVIQNYQQKIKEICG